MDYTKGLYRAKFSYDRVPVLIQRYAAYRFMKLRRLAVEPYNALISKVNGEWDKTGKPYAFGDYVEDINPEYVCFVQDHIQHVIDKDVNRESGLVKVFIDQYGDLCGRIDCIKGSKITLSLEPINPKD